MRDCKYSKINILSHHATKNGTPGLLYMEKSDGFGSGTVVMEELVWDSVLSLELSKSCGLSHMTPESCVEGDMCSLDTTYMSFCLFVFWHRSKN